MRCRTAGKLLREPIVPVKLEIVAIETHTFVLLLQLRNEGGDAVKFLFPHLDVFSSPGCADYVVYRFGMQQKAVLLAVNCERRKIVQILKIYCGVDLNGVVLEVALDVIERAENRRQSINAPPLCKLLAIERVNRDLQLVELDAGLGILLKRQSVRRHGGVETFAGGILDVVRHVRIHQRLAARHAPGEDAKLRRLVHAREHSLAHRAILRLLVLPNGAVAALHVAV